MSDDEKQTDALGRRVWDKVRIQSLAHAESMLGKGQDDKSYLFQMRAILELYITSRSTWPCVALFYSPASLPSSFSC